MVVAPGPVRRQAAPVVARRLQGKGHRGLGLPVERDLVHGRAQRRERDAAPGAAHRPVHVAEEDVLDAAGLGHDPGKTRGLGGSEYLR